ncbi:MAG: flagellar hook-basal body complex protein FliE [Acidobacteria bacterium]|nr:flagellar hook-basal body complex protein FliE [Acidobacteriota bacterium]
MPLSSVTPIAPPIRPEHVDAPKTSEGGGFDKLLTQAIGEVEKYRLNSEAATNRFLTGETQEIHQMVLESQRAEIAFETFLQVRNKVVQAYQEVMRMQM